MYKLKSFIFIVFLLSSQTAAAAMVTEEWTARITGTRHLDSFFLVGNTFNWRISYEDSVPHSNISFSGTVFDDIKTHSESFHSLFNIGTYDNRNSYVDAFGFRVTSFNKDYQLNFGASNAPTQQRNNILSYKYNTQYANGGVSAISSAITFEVESVTVVPVPAAAWLFGTGLLGLAGIARRK